MSADKSEKPCIKQLGFGIGITVTANFCFLASSFIVREYPLNGGELCLSKGVLQVSRPNRRINKCLSYPPFQTIFFTITAYGFCKKNSSVRCLADQEDNWLRLWVAIYGVCNGIMILAGYIALKMIPVSDYIVFGYTSVIFTIAFSACILK